MDSCRLGYLLIMSTIIKLAITHTNQMNMDLKIYTTQIITKLFALSVIVAVLTAYVTGESRPTDTLV